jgi:Ca2+-binding RTX toxin-like protein
MTPSSLAKAGRLRLATVVSAVLVLACSIGIATASGDVSHVGWPHHVTVWFASNGGQRGVGTDGNDMLLGGAGSDVIFGGPGDDIIWGDQHPSPNGPDQVDVLHGGPGSDWIYTSHGDNHVFAGTGDDHVFDYFGHGTINCGPGNDIVTTDKSHIHDFTYVGCEVVKIGFP